MGQLGLIIVEKPKRQKGNNSLGRKRGSTYMSNGNKRQKTQQFPVLNFPTLKNCSDHPWPWHNRRGKNNSPTGSTIRLERGSSSPWISLQEGSGNGLKNRGWTVTCSWATQSKLLNHRMWYGASYKRGGREERKKLRMKCGNPNVKYRNHHIYTLKSKTRCPSVPPLTRGEGEEPSLRFEYWPGAGRAQLWLWPRALGPRQSWVTACSRPGWLVWYGRGCASRESWGRLHGRESAWERPHSLPHPATCSTCPLLLLTFSSNFSLDKIRAAFVTSPWPGQGWGYHHCWLLLSKRYHPEGKQQGRTGTVGTGIRGTSTGVGAGTYRVDKELRVPKGQGSGLHQLLTSLWKMQYICSLRWNSDCAYSVSCSLTTYEATDFK